MASQKNNQFIKESIQLVKPYLGRVAIAVLFGLAASAINGLIAWMVKPVTDTIFLDKSQIDIKWLPIGVIAIFFARGLFQMIYNYLMRSAGAKLVRDYRIKLYGHILHVPVSAFGSETSGRIISRMLNDTAMLRPLVSDTLLTIMKEIPTVVVLLGVALYRRWDITLLALIVLPGIGITTQRLGKLVKKKRKQAQQSIASITHRISEAITGARVIKIFIREDFFLRRFIKESKANYRQEIKIIWLKEATKLIVESSTGIGAAIVIGYGGYLVIQGIITTGDLFSALGAVVMIFGPVKKLGSSYAVFQEIRGAVDRLKWLEALPLEKSGDKKFKKFKQDIKFHSVSHRYEDQGDFVLKDVDLEIVKGQTLALVGHSGAGKSTMVDLIPRFFDPTSGFITIDGIDLKELVLKDLRAHIGLVSQDVILFNDTVRENIAFGRPNATFEQIQEAAKKAFAHEFIIELPHGYDTILGERGYNLSGGQRQRIAIARAILKDPPILILDEATSALDTVSEALVQKAIYRLMKNRTTIVVAHRLSTIKNADRIVVLDQGKIVSIGSHEELLSSCSVYQNLYLGMK